MPSTERPWERIAAIAANDFAKNPTASALGYAKALGLCEHQLRKVERENTELREQLHPTKKGPLSGDPKGLA